MTKQCARILAAGFAAALAGSLLGNAIAAFGQPLGTGGYMGAQIHDDGTPLTLRGHIDCLPAGTCADNAGTLRTEINLAPAMAACSVSGRRWFDR